MADQPSKTFPAGTPIDDIFKYLEEHSKSEFDKAVEQMPITLRDLRTVVTSFSELLQKMIDAQHMTQEQVDILRQLYNQVHDRVKNIEVINGKVS